MSKNTLNLNRIGIVDLDPPFLQDKLLVSALQILEPEIAQQQGYGYREVIVPTQPHKPTQEQLEAIMPDEYTTHLLRLTRLPASIGHRALHHIKAPGFRMDPTNILDLGSDFSGAPLSFRLDKPDQMNVSVDNDGLKVGDHIDTWDDSSLQLAILNMGPGKRWHRIAPAFCRDDMNGERPSPGARHAHMRELLKSGEDLLTYWVPLGAPAVNTTGSTVEAIVSSPVARYLHEGSTHGCDQASTAVFIATPAES